MKTNIKIPNTLIPLLLTSLVPSLMMAQVNIKDGSFEKTFDQDVVRHYHSRSLYNGYFGFGWCSELETSLVTGQDRTLTLKDCTLGSEITFDKIYKNVYISAALPEERIIWKDGIFTRHVGGGKEQRFDSKGKLTSTTNAQGKSRILAYDRLGVLSALTDHQGQIYTVKMDSFGQRIIEISSNIKNRFKYIYYNDDLLEVQHSGNSIYKYDYDKLHNLTQITTLTQGKTITETLRYNPEKDWVIEYTDEKLCQEFYQYRATNTDHYSAEAQRFCKNEKPKTATYEFFQKIHKQGFKFLDRVVITAKNGLGSSKVFEVKYDAYSGIPLNTQTRRIANDEK